MKHKKDTKPTLESEPLPEVLAKRGPRINMTRATFAELDDAERKRLKDGHAVVMATFKNGQRLKANVTAVTGASFDLDAGAPAIADVLARMEGLDCTVHETASSTPEQPRLRLFVPYAAPVPVSVHETAWDALAGRLDPDHNWLDAKLGRDANRLSFCPPHFDDWAPEIHRVEGELFDPRAVKADSAGVFEPAFDEKPKLDHEEYLQQIATGESYHDALLRLSMSMVSKGVEPDVVEAMLDAWLVRYEPDPRSPEHARWERERKDLHRTVTSAVEKGALTAPPDGRFAHLAPRPPGRAALAIQTDEWDGAKLTPKCIVENHLFADVAQRIAPGGTGKTTLTLWEAVHIAMGLPLYGQRIVTPGWVLYITAEDPRERLVARLREICTGMFLDESEIAQVGRDLLFWDLTAQPARLAMEADGNILLTPLAERIVEVFKDDPPVLVEFDPTVSFGASESRVNDNEQALVLAGRVIVKGLDCCVRFTHHTGKGNARDKTTDQYSGRGGSAMADGCRMVHVLQSWAAKDKGTPPPSLNIGPQTGVITYTRAKMSHCPPNQPVIWIARNGFTYEWAEEHRLTPEQAAGANAEQVLQFLRSEIKAKRYHTQRSLEDGQLATLGMTRAALREALAELEVSNRAALYDLPEHLKQGRRQSYLCPRDLTPPNPAQCGAIPEEAGHATF